MTTLLSTLSALINGTGRKAHLDGLALSFHPGDAFNPERLAAGRLHQYPDPAETQQLLDALHQVTGARAIVAGNVVMRAGGFRGYRVVEFYWKRPEAGGSHV